jgi:hypothetical protein
MKLNEFFENLGVIYKKPVNFLTFLFEGKKYSEENLAAVEESKNHIYQIQEQLLKNKNPKMRELIKGKIADLLLKSDTNVLTFSLLSAARKVLDRMYVKKAKGGINSYAFEKFMENQFFTEGRDIEVGEEETIPSTRLQKELGLDNNTNISEEDVEKISNMEPGDMFTFEKKKVLDKGEKEKYEKSLKNLISKKINISPETISAEILKKLSSIETDKSFSINNLKFTMDKELSMYVKTLLKIINSKKDLIIKDKKVPKAEIEITQAAIDEANKVLLHYKGESLITVKKDTSKTAAKAKNKSIAGFVYETLFTGKDYFNVNMKDKDNLDKTALIQACERGDLSIVKYLVEDLHANMNSKDRNGNTCLMAAIENGNVSILSYLLENYGKTLEGFINSRNNAGYSPLLLSLTYDPKANKEVPKNKKIAMAKILIQKGAAYTEEDKKIKPDIEETFKSLNK